MTRTLLRAGHIHTPSSPGATAMLVDAGEVAWVGSETAADDVAAAGGDLAVVHLAGALVTPAFVDAHVHAGPAADGVRRRAAGLGIGSVHLLGGPADGSEADFRTMLAMAAEGPGPEVVGCWAEEVGAAARVRDHSVACAAARLQPAFHLGGDADLDSILAGLREAAERVGIEALRASRPRLEHPAAASPGQIDALAELGVHVSVRPTAKDQAAGELPYADLAASGVPLAFGSGAPEAPLGPWEAVRAAAHHPAPAARLSVRAAFAAHTRGGWRAAGRDEAGVLAPGAPATYSVWEPRELVVRAPDDRIRQWSTDPRAGVPGLPDLSPGAPAPRCLRTVVRGVVIHDTQELEAA